MVQSIVNHRVAAAQLCCQLATAVLSLFVLGSPAPAQEIRLKNGLVLKGTPQRVQTMYTGDRKPKNYDEIVGYPIQSVTTPVKRYFVPYFQVDEESRDADLSRHEVFRFKHQKQSGGASRQIAVVGGYAEVPPPFDEHGRRLVRLASPTGDLAVIQAISEIGPESIKLVALNYVWETAMATSSLPIDQLDAILRKAVDPAKLDSRLQIARFYIQSQNFAQAERELVAISQQFPEQSKTISQVRQSLAQDRASQILAELKLRQRAGQHALVYDLCRRFPSDEVSTTILREVRELQSEYEATVERAARVRDLLADLQGRLDDTRLSDKVAPLRTDLLAQLNHANIGRLDAFLNLSVDPKLTAAEKLALALSGWVVGSDNAVTELDQAIALWQARTLALDFLRSDADAGKERRHLIESLQSLEGVGPQRVAQILPLLPPPRDPAGAQPGRVSEIQATGDRDEVAVSYSVFLPPEYHHERAYPVIVALHAEGKPTAHEATFWAGTEQRQGQAARHGYIVIAPEYVSKTSQSQYDYSVLAHTRVLLALQDAASRYSIDHDRIFLSGHQMGGDAAFDLGFSHPDLFAGVIPIAGVSDQICQFYWENARETPFFIILGQLDRDTVARNERELERMMRHKFDTVYVEYSGSGPDSFYAEIHTVFDWMSRLQRTRHPRRIDAKVLRTTENRFHWLEIGDPPATNRLVRNEAGRKSGTKTLKIEAEVYQPANRIEVFNKTPRTRLSLSPQGGFINFDKRLTVNVNSRQRFSDFVKPSIEAMLESARSTGDRQNICWAVLDL